MVYIIELLHMGCDTFHVLKPTFRISIWLVSPEQEMAEMWRYFDINEYRSFLLSLNLTNSKNDVAYIRKLYSISNNIPGNYRTHRIPKYDGTFRVIHEPSDTLKHIQRQILKNVLSEIPVSSYAKAYCKGVSLADNALPHIGKEIVLKLDIRHFFDSISFIDVYNYCFPETRFPKPAGMLLTNLCTYEDFLPQGAPTSAYISNLVMKPFDESLGCFCKKRDIAYTRYSDDMTFSGAFDPGEIISEVRDKLNAMGMGLNDKKTHVISSNRQQAVTGIVVNEKLQVNRKYRRKIRQEMYFLKRYGECNEPSSSIAGKVQFVLQVNENDKEFIEYAKVLKPLLNTDG